jgi:hypothetical protein
MIFMRYKSAEVEGLTPGKIYFGEPIVQSGELVSYDSIKIRDDNNKPLRIDPTKEEFEFLDEVYAVYLQDEVLKGQTVGTVVILTDIEIKEDKCFVEIKDVGYRSCNTVLVLDRTNVYPGISVLDRFTNHWESVYSVNESLWIKVSSECDYRPPTTLRFAIHEGDILIRPLVTCIQEDGQSLTEGKHYLLISGGFDNDGIVEITNDSGHISQYLASRFKIF